MSTNNLEKRQELQTAFDRILSGSLQKTRTEPLKDRDSSVQLRQFSPFVAEDLTQAISLMNEFKKVADAEDSRQLGLEKALERIEEEIKKETVDGVVHYATKLFLTHYAPARKEIRFGLLEHRQPSLVLPSHKESGEGATPPEDKLDFWREDPLINEHHEHWHLVYPDPLPNLPEDEKGDPAPEPAPLGNRHGELFAYMHQQMLARYDAERIAVGLEPVVSFTNFNEPIIEGYNPGDLKFFTEDDEWIKFSSRPPGVTISDLTLKPFKFRPGATVEQHHQIYDNLLNAAKSGVFNVNGIQTPVSIDLLGATVEATIATVDPIGTKDQNNTTYGNCHNTGHIHFAFYDNNPKLYGVMASTATAVRDPIFWRWHKAVDGIFSTFQDAKLPPYEFSDSPAVKIHKDTSQSGYASSKDLILCLKSGISGMTDKELEEVGTKFFGYSDDPDKNHWDKDFAVTTVTLPDGKVINTTDTLNTWMEERKITLNKDDWGLDVTETINFLSHEDFYYFIRVENSSDKQLWVTVRIFLAPEIHINNRNSWIEMDKFSYQLQPNERAVIFRPADQSSVIRKPALRDQDLKSSDGSSPITNQQQWCDCGWPYTLLLPRGTTEGMPFQLFVMFSNGLDLVNHEKTGNKCNSASYCGLQNNDYPDLREMGYPFNRPFQGQDGISAIVSKQENMAVRTINIKWRAIAGLEDIREFELTNTNCPLGYYY